jgi:hypothetical protein
MKLPIRSLAAATAIALSFVIAPVSAQAQSHHRDWKPSHSHKQVCHTERKKVKHHGRWIVEKVKVCRR